MPGAVAVRGLRELELLFAAAGRDSKKALKKALLEVAEPVRREAETLAVEQIRNMTIPWSRMRIGVTTKSVYIAPRKRGVKSHNPFDPRRRPNLVGLMLERSMEPALEGNRREIEHGMERLFEQVANNFNRGTTVG